MRSTLTVLVIIALLSERTFAAIPVRLSDLGLALKPIIVVARWSGDPVTGHDVRKTRIIIERVIEGDVRPGEYPLVIAGADSWNKQGKPSTWWGPAEVDNVGQSNLWFLSREKSPDPTIKGEFLTLDAGRGIQRLTLEPFYAALRKSDRDSRIVDFLQPSNELAALRALRYIHLGTDGWPYGPELESIIEHKDSARQPLTQHTDAVWQLVVGSHGELRQKSLAVYAALAGKGATVRLRFLLDDSDPEIRHIAVGYLARFKDRESAPRFARALSGRVNYPCEIIDVLAACRDLRLIPALITLLEPDAAHRNEEWIAPSIRARDVLRKMTGVTFPLSVAESMSAWQRAEHSSTAAGRARILRSIFGDLADPLVVVALQSGGPGRVAIRNRSSRPITVTRLPGFVEIDCGQGSGGFAVHTGRRPEFVDLSPEQRLTVTIDLPDDFKSLWKEFVSSPRMRGHSMKLTWEDNGYTSHRRAWIGVVPVSVAPVVHSKAAIFRRK